MLYLDAAIAAAPKDLLGKVSLSVLTPFLNQCTQICIDAVAQINVFAHLDLSIICGGLSLSACAAIIVRIFLVSLPLVSSGPNSKQAFRSGLETCPGPPDLPRRRRYLTDRGLPRYHRSGQVSYSFST